jgi:mannan endo-1,4-beta-mannosidase
MTGSKMALHTEGKYLLEQTGNRVVLRGINLPLLDNWDFPGSDKLAELEKSGANAVRIQWYQTYGSPERPPYSIADLDDVLTQCRAAAMIPIVMLADLTCQADTGLLNSQLIPWWTSEPVVTLLQKHCDYLIINLANELGSYRWAGDDDAQKAALAAFTDAYQTAITAVRNAGLNGPVMIDAPDCGTSINAFSAVGQQLIEHDPEHNLLLSTHAYWAGYDGTPELTVALEANLPIVFGEVANKQDEQVNESTVYGYFDLDGTGENHPPPTGFSYQSLLGTLQANGIGWLAWSWGPDACKERRISVDGDFSGLTPYGDDIVNNPTYGLKATSARVPAPPLDL